MNNQAADLESLTMAVKDTLAFLEGSSASEFADGAYHTHQLAKELAYFLVQQGNSLRTKKDRDLNIKGLASLHLAMGRVETWLATRDKPPEKHPNIVVQGDVDHDFQIWLKNSQAHLQVEVQRFIPRTKNYEEAVISEAVALKDGYRIYADIASKQKTKQQPWRRMWPGAGRNGYGKEKAPVE